MMEVGKVFMISNCSLKPANRQFSTIKNEFEITFRDATEVIPCDGDNSSVPSITFNFCRIADLNPSLKDQVHI
jgi:replication factor A1